MKTEIQIFKNEQFGEIRTMVDEKGEPWFVGKDVARRLGYINHRKALRDHVDEEDRKDGVTIRDSIGRDQEATFINESGLYSLILASKLPQAKAFKRWVTSEVLPQIRKTGGYIPTRDAQGRQLSEQEVVRVANRIAQRTVKQKNLAADNCLSASEVAKRVGLGDAKLLNSMLVDRGVIKWTGGRYRLTPEYEGRGLAQDRFFLYRSLEGEQKERSYLVWTLTGADFIEDFLHF
ncbi:MAG: phage antirepressor KilAC domain-containing protein [Prevotella sp.]|nr:phage antirepressor KilAC domain-containing protein [Prevotella sp.]